MRALRHFVLLSALSISCTAFAQAPADNDHTLQAMRDEMARAKSRLELQIPKLEQPVRPYYLEYRLLGDFQSQSQPGHECFCASG
jgi:hypothetical protein